MLPKILIAIIQGKRSDNTYPNSQKMEEIIEKLNGDEKGKIQEDNLVYILDLALMGKLVQFLDFMKRLIKNLF